MTGIPRNPYIAGRALSGVRGFCGRDDVFRVVQTELEQPDRNAIVLFGQRRIGKTSILLNLRTRLPSPPIVAVYFDLMDRARKSLGDVLFEIAQNIAGELNLSAPARADFSQDGAAFRRIFLPIAYQAIGKDQRLVLLLDEFDVLDVRQEEQLPDTSAARAFFPYLRELMMNEAQLGFVFVVGRKAGELSTDFKAAFKAARYYRISVLDEPSARELVLTAQREGTLAFGDGSADRILALTAYHPYFTQLVCQLLYERAYQDHTAVDELPCISIEDVNAVVARVLEAGENVFEWIWDGLPPAERVIFSAIAAGTVENTVVTEERLLNILQDSGVRILVRELEVAPKTLIDWEMLKQTDGGYRFTVELMRRWVVARKPLIKVKDELDRINPLADMLYQVATSFYRSGQLDNAIAQLQQATAVNPNHLKARLLLGELYKVQGRLDDMLREYAEAYRIDEDASRVLYEAALILRAEGFEKTNQPDEAVRIYSLALHIAPNGRVAGERLADIQTNQKQREVARYAESAQDAAKRELWDDAIVAYERLAVLDDTNPRWRTELERATRERELAQRYAQGLSAAGQRNWSVAQQSFGDVVGLRSNYKDAVTRLDVATREVERAKGQGGVIADSRGTILVDWLLGTLVGWLLGMLVGALLTVPAIRPGNSLSNSSVLLSLFLGSGLATVFQWLVLDARVSRAWQWLTVTLGGLVGMVVLLLVSAQVVNSITAVNPWLIGLMLPGFAQYLILRKYARRTGWWIAAYGLSLVAAMIIAALAIVPVDLKSRSGSLLAICEIGAVFGLVMGAGTGLTLSRLLSPGTISVISLRPRRLLPTVVGVTAVLIAVIGALILNRPPVGLVRTLDDLAFDAKFSPDGTMIATSSNGVELWNVNNGTKITHINATGIVDSVAFSPDGVSLVFDDANLIRLVRNVSDAGKVETLSSITATVHALAFSPDGHFLLSGGEDRSLRLWHAQDGKQVQQYTINDKASSSLSLQFAPDSKSFIANGFDGDIAALWNIDGVHPVYTSASTTDAAFSPDGVYIAAVDYEGIHLYRRTDMQQVGRGTLNGNAYTIAISADSTLYAVADYSGLIHLFHLNPNLQLSELHVFDTSDSIKRLTFSPNGELLMSVSFGGVVRLWQVPKLPVQTQQAAPTFAGAAALRLSQVLTGHSSAVFSIAYAPQGQLLATGSNDETISLWDFSNSKTGMPGRTVLLGHNSAVNSLAFRPDGKMLASGSQDKTILLWDVSKPGAPVTLTSPLTGHSDRVSGLAFAPSGYVMASAGYDNKVILWDVSVPTAPNLLNVLTGHTDKVQTIAFSPDGKTLASGSFDHTIILWDVSHPATAHQIGKPLTGHTNWVMSVAFSPDGKILASGGNDDKIILWDMTDPLAAKSLSELNGHKNTVQSLAFDPSGKLLVTTGDDSQLILWNVADTQAPVQSGAPQLVSKSTVWAVAFNQKNGQVATGDENGDVKLWDVTR